MGAAALLLLFGEGAAVAAGVGGGWAEAFFAYVPGVIHPHTYIPGSEQERAYAPGAEQVEGI